MKHQALPKLIVIGVLTLVALIQPMISQASQLDQRPGFQQTRCPNNLADLPDFECGYLMVPEDHAHPNGNTIQLMVAIAHSISETPASDPVIVLAGGPGAGAVGSSASSLIEKRIREHRSIIYLDQRGTGYSQPSLACPELENVQTATSLGSSPEQIVTARLRACRDRLTSAGIDLTKYTSAQSAADVDMLRQSLGYMQINLWGTSYGTRLALTIIRDFPDGIRSAILDSVYPPVVDIYREIPANAERAFRILTEQCAMDVLCNLLYPNLQDVFLETYERLNRQPAHIVLDGSNLTLTLTGDLFASGVFGMLYDAPAIRYLPAMIYAIRNGDYAIVKTIGSALANVKISYGMLFSVQCSEEAAFSTNAEIVAATNQYPQAMRMSDNIFSPTAHQFCSMWPITTPDPKENKPVSGNMPILMLVGEHDPVTPPQWAYVAAKTLRHSYVFEFPGVGHAVIASNSCSAVMAAGFIESPQTMPDSSCIKALTRIGYVITAPATRPIANTGAVVLGTLGIFLSVYTFQQAFISRRQFTWNATRRLITWFPVLAAALAVFVPLMGNLENKDKLRLVELAIPAAFAVQAALCLAPNDDRCLEVIMACPRSPMWLPLERIAQPLLVYTGLAVTASLAALAVTGEYDIVLALLRWIPTTLMFGGIGLFVTIRSRQMVFGALLSLLILGGTAVLGAALLPGQITVFPLNYLQPFLWIVHPYLQPGELAPADYALNRIIVAGVGLAFFAWAVWTLRDVEKFLFGTKAVKWHEHRS